MRIPLIVEWNPRDSEALTGPLIRLGEGIWRFSPSMSEDYVIASTMEGLIKPNQEISGPIEVRVVLQVMKRLTVYAERIGDGDAT